MTRPVLRARSTSHTVAAHDGCTKIPLAAHRAQEDENHSRKRRFRPWLASVRPPGSARTDQVQEDDGVRLECSSSGRHCGAFDHDTGGYIFPERDQQLPRQRHDRRLAQAAAIKADSFVKPKGERRVRLIAQPQPRELDQRCSQSWISGFGHSLFPIDRSALPGCWRQARISGDLTSVVEVAEEPFRPKYGGELRTNAFNIQQHRRRHRRRGMRRDQQCVPLGLHGFDLLEKHFEPIELAVDLRLEMRGQGTAVAGVEFFQPLMPVAAQRLVSGYPDLPPEEWTPGYADFAS